VKTINTHGVVKFTKSFSILLAEIYFQIVFEVRFHELINGIGLSDLPCSPNDQWLTVWTAFPVIQICINKTFHLFQQRYTKYKNTIGFWVFLSKTLLDLRYFTSKTRLVFGYYYIAASGFNLCVV